MYLNKKTEEEVLQFKNLSEPELSEIRKELDKKLFENFFYLKGFDKPIPVQLNSVFLTTEERDSMFHKSALVISAIFKVVEEYLKSESLQKIIKIDIFEKNLFLSAPKQKGFGAMRLDAFWDGQTFKFVELNSDYPEGVVIFQNMCDAHNKVMNLEPENKIDNKELFYQNIISVWEMNGGKSTPVIAVIGPKDRLFITEYNLLVEYIKSKGHESFLVEPNEIERKEDGYLYYHGMKIDIIRRAGEIRYFKKEPSASVIFDTYKDGKVIVINSFHDRLCGIKSIFAVLHSKEYEKLFSEKELSVIKETIPYTFILGESDVKTEPFWEKKDDYVLKPSDLSEGEDIIFGNTKDLKMWQELLNSSKHSGWIVQELINLKKRTIVDFQDGKKIVKELYTDFMIHTFMDRNGEIVFGNIGNRTSESPIVNVAKGGGINQVKIIDK